MRPRARTRGRSDVRVAAWAAAALGAALLAQPLRAQVTLSGAGLVSVVEHRVSAGRGVEESSGSIAGGIGVLRIGSLEIEVAGASGSLAAESASAEDRDLAQGSARATVLAVPWLALYGGVTVRSYATTFARQRWVASRLGAEARLVFVGGALVSVLSAELMPTVSVSGVEKPNRAIAAGAGILWRRGILTAGVRYTIERYDFALSGDVKRREQLAALTAHLGLRLGARD